MCKIRAYGMENRKIYLRSLRDGCLDIISIGEVLTNENIEGPGDGPKEARSRQDCHQQQAVELEVCPY